MSSGEQKAWEILDKLNPNDVCRKADVIFDKASGIYTLKSYSMDSYISPGRMEIFSNSAGSDVLLHRLGYFFKLSALCYLNNAKDIPLTERLVKPVNLRGGELFFRGSHVLPLDKIAEKYGDNIEGFLTKGKDLAGEQLEYGDASLRLFPFPRVSVVLILWRADDEFPSRADLLFDSTSELQLPIDTIWAIAMMSILIML